MTIIETQELLRYRRPSWDPGRFITRSGKYFFSYEVTTCSLPAEDVMATDWELYDEHSPTVTVEQPGKASFGRSGAVALVVVCDDCGQPKNLSLKIETV